MRPQVRERILRRDNYKCQKCGSTENLQIDHIIPISREGKENEDNMQVLCRTCNLKKGKSIDFSQYFITNISSDYILMRQDFPISSTKGRELQQILISMFDKAGINV